MTTEVVFICLTAMAYIIWKIIQLVRRNDGDDDDNEDWTIHFSRRRRGPRDGSGN